MFGRQHLLSRKLKNTTKPMMLRMCEDAPVAHCSTRRASNSQMTPSTCVLVLGSVDNDLGQNPLPAVKGTFMNGGMRETSQPCA